MANRVSDSAADFAEAAKRALENYHQALAYFDAFAIAGDWENAARAATNASANLEAFLDARLAAWQRMAE